MRIRRIIALIICIAICISASVMLVSCDDKAEESEVSARIPLYNQTGLPQKAIVILPGILGSNLVDESGKALWSAGALISNIAMNDEMISDGALNYEMVEAYLASFLLRDENGNAKVKVRAATMNDPDLEYGVLGSYGDLYRLLDEQFGLNTSYKRSVVVFQYDWTQSCVDSARDLQELITKNQYEDVVLVGHSMGGIVIDNYLAQAKANRDNTAGVITLGTPHLGAVDAACLNLGGGMPVALSLMDSALLKSITSELEGRLTESVDYVALGVKLSNMLRNMARTIPSTYELFPTDALAETTVCAESAPYIVEAPVDVPTIVETMKTLSWVNGNAHISAIANGLHSKQQALYVDGTFVADTVKTYYLAGSGATTTCSSKYSVSSDFLLTDYDTSTKGDSLVLVDSAFAGGEGDNRIILDGVDHLSLVKVGTSGSRTAVGTKIGEVAAKLMSRA